MCVCGGGGGLTRYVRAFLPTHTRPFRPTIPPTYNPQIQNFGDILQLIIVELVYKVCRQNPAERSRFIRCIYMLLNSNSPAVRYEAGVCLCLCVCVCVCVCE